MKGYLGCFTGDRFLICDGQGFQEKFLGHNPKGCELTYNDNKCKRIQTKKLGYELHG